MPLLPQCTAQAMVAAATLAMLTAPVGATRGWVDVTDFGASPLGLSDSSESTRRALANLSATGGGTLYFPPGRFAFLSQVAITGYSIKVLGAGAVPSACIREGTTLMAAGDSSALLFFVNCTFCSVEHLALAHKATCGAGSCQEATAVAAAVVRYKHQRRIAHKSSRRDHGAAKVSDTELPTPTTCTEISLRSNSPPTAGAAIEIAGAFQTTISNVWIHSVFIGIYAHSMANTITVLDSQVSDVYGPSGILTVGSAPGKRVDILQISRLTTNNGDPRANSSCVWIDIGAGTNTVRLDNVGLINGGTGVMMSSPADAPAGSDPGRPLFLIANDLEIDFPQSHAISLLAGEEVQLSNCYFQGSLNGSGVYIGPQWNSEFTMTNSRIFGHHRAGIEVSGGAHAVLSNNIIGANGNGILIRAGVSDFVVQGNHIGNVFKGSGTTSQAHGVQIEEGISDRYVISANTLTGNNAQPLVDGGSGKDKVVENNAQTVNWVART